MSRCASESRVDWVFSCLRLLVRGAQINVLCRFLCGALFVQSALGQPAPDTRVRIESNREMSIAQYAVDAHDVKIDGKIDEAIWQELPVYDEFAIIEPDTLKPSRTPTLIRLFTTKRGLYVSADMHQPQETLIARLSGRDNGQLNRDSINLTLDTSGSGRYGFWFGVGLGNSLSDGTVLPERKFSNEWDGPWRGASSVTDQGWSAELFIPWGTIAMPVATEGRTMGFYMSRKVAYLDERWAWPALPRTQAKFMSKLQVVKLEDVQPRQQYNLYPFTSITRDEVDGETRYQFGADLFWRPSPNLQVNATINPDFGGVESDRVDVNLTATETFFPEKRLFFQEGQQIFVASPRAQINRGGVGQGGDPYTLVNTRRIGGQARAPAIPAGLDVSDRELLQPADLIGALKVSGQSGRIRYGLLGAFEKDTTFDATGLGPGGVLGDENLRVSGSDYGIARALYEDNAGGAYRALGVLSTAVLHEEGNALAQAVDWHYLTPNGVLSFDGQAFTSDIDGVGRGWGGFWDFEYTPRQGSRYRLGVEHTDRLVDLNDLGFLSRNDRSRVRASHVRTSSNSRIGRNNQFDVRGFVDKNSADEFLGAGLFVSDRLTLNNLSSVTVRLGHFTPGFDDINSFGNGSYRIDARSDAAIEYATNNSARLSYRVGAGFREENLGGDSFNGNIALSWRPIDRMNIEASVRYTKRDGWLLHQEERNFTTFAADILQPRIALEYFFTARQQFSFNAQWIGIKAREQDFFLVPDAPGALIPTNRPAGPTDDFAITDLIIQARYRWEIAPLSDLFIVYTRIADISTRLDNDSFEDLLNRSLDEPQTNQIVMKLRYRFGS